MGAVLAAASPLDDAGGALSAATAGTLDATLVTHHATTGVPVGVAVLPQGADVLAASEAAMARFDHGFADGKPGVLVVLAGDTLRVAVSDALTDQLTRAEVERVTAEASRTMRAGDMDGALLGLVDAICADVRTQRSRSAFLPVVVSAALSALLAGGLGALLVTRRKRGGGDPASA